MPSKNERSLLDIAGILGDEQAEELRRIVAKRREQRRRADR